MEKLSDFIKNNVDKKERTKLSVMYNLCSFYERLKSREESRFLKEELVITPFYYDKAVYEFYYYGLLITDQSKYKDRDSFVTAVLNKNSLKGTDARRINILRRRIIIADAEKGHYYKAEVLGYIEWLMSLRDIKDTAEKLYGEFNYKNLYFEVL
ncbi:MAG: hypothetical protein LUD81_00795 [Clostridiales bacterium]|nr:hypothetical protein [Clostridiales bacterium]